jgi:hypothetical protein
MDGREDDAGGRLACEERTIVLDVKTTTSNRAHVLRTFGFTALTKIR